MGSHFVARKVDVNAWGSWLRWQVEGSNEPLRNQPHGQGGISIDWKPSARVLIGGGFTAMGARYDYELPVPQIDKAGAFTTTTLRAQWQMRRDLAVHLRIENAFNQSYRQLVGFPDPGIRVRAGLAWTFAGPRGHS